MAMHECGRSRFKRAVLPTGSFDSGRGFRAAGIREREFQAAEAFATPLNRVEDLWPNSVKPHPEEPVGEEKPKLIRTLPPQAGHLMSQGERAQAPVRRGCEHATRAGKRGRKEL
jgi:hypothetical protein